MDIRGLADTGGTAPPRASYSLEMANQQSAPLVCTQPRHHPHLATCSNHARARHQTARGSPYAPEPTETTQTCRPCCSPRQTQEGLLPTLSPASASWLTRVLPPRVPTPDGCSLLLGVVRNQLPPQWHLLPDLVASLCLSDKGAYFLKSLQKVDLWHSG